jgi:hypothetical protein
MCKAYPQAGKALAQLKNNSRTWTQSAVAFKNHLNRGCKNHVMFIRSSTTGPAHGDGPVLRP